jgi:poly(3-hydroxybutyrate) depolymerase
MGVLKNGADTDVLRISRSARDDADPSALPVPLLAIQGGGDDAVAPINAVQLVRQYLTLNAHPAANAGPAGTLPPPDRSTATSTPDGRMVTTSEWQVEGRQVARHVLIDGLGHAWSGGDDRYPYHDSHMPDATALLADFIDQTVQ